MRPADLALAASVRADLAAGTARLRRQQAGVSQSEMARSLGVSHQTVSGWEANRHVPSAEHALAYGRLLARLVREAA